MFQFRPFLNTDPPLIVDIWRRQQPLPAVVESLTRDILDRHVLSKQYFDRQGFFLALQGETPVGFVHAGFGPNKDLTDLDRTVGIICQLKIVQGQPVSEISQPLLNLAANYLREQGSTECVAGCLFPYAPFYLGIYGGSRIPGILVEDQTTLAALQEYGFKTAQKIGIFSRKLSDFRIPVDRQLMSVRRQFQTVAEADPLETSWWECCTLGMAERDCFRAVDRSSKEVAASIGFWDIQPLASEWGVAARGIHDMTVQPEQQGKGVEKYLLGEAMKHLSQQGIGVVEAQTALNNNAAVEVFQRLGFEQVDSGWLMHLKL